LELEIFIMFPLPERFSDPALVALSSKRPTFELTQTIGGSTELLELELKLELVSELTELEVEELLDDSGGGGVELTTVELLEELDSEEPLETDEPGVLLSTDVETLLPTELPTSEETAEDCSLPPVPPDDPPPEDVTELPPLDSLEAPLLPTEDAREE
jgi:hypothetical protein